MMNRILRKLRRTSLNLGTSILRQAPSVFRRAVMKSIYAPHQSGFDASGKAPLFDTVYFELRTRCNGSCAFCSASVQNDTRPDQIMDRQLFEAILAQLKELDFSGRVGFHVNNDPLIVPDIESCVALARHHLPKAWLQILTNGRALNNTLGEKLLDAGINELSINWYTADVSQPLPNHILSFQDQVLLRRFPPERLGSGHGPGEDRTVFRFNAFRRQINAVLTNRAGTAPNKAPLIKTDHLGFCIYPFTQLNITVDGRVSKCCADVGFQDPMGDLTCQNLMDVWNGHRFCQVRRSLLTRDRSALTHCKECDYLGIRPPSSKMRWIEEVGFRAVSQGE